MVIIETPLLLQREIARLHQQDQRLALVMIDGAIHESEQAVIAAAQQQAEVVMVTLLPAAPMSSSAADAHRQQAYEILHRQGVALVFAPALSELWPASPQPVAQLTLNVPPLPADSQPSAAALALRATLLCKCLNMIQPTVLCLSERPAVAGWLARSLITDFSYPLRLAIVPAARASDGLVSDETSRLLNAEQRRRAAQLPQQLQAMAMQLSNDGASPQAVIAAGAAALAAQGLQVDALTLSDAVTLAPLSETSEQALIAGAVRLGDIHLTDTLTVALNPSFSDV